MPTKTAAKKAGAAKKAAAKKEAPETNGTGRGRKFSPDMELAAAIKKDRDSDMGWAEIAEKHEVAQGKAMLLFMVASVPAKERITGTEEEVGKAIVKARNEGESWGRLSARAGIGEGKVRTLFEAHGGGSAADSRTGKGGRYPGGGSPAPKKASGSTKKAAAKGGSPLVDQSLGDLKTRLTGKTIKLVDGATHAVKKIVKKSNDGELTFVDDEGTKQTVLLTHVKSATK